jgi:hypothetical protein
MSPNSTFRIMSESSHNVVLAHLVIHEPGQLDSVKCVGNVGNTFCEKKHLV